MLNNEVYELKAPYQFVKINSFMKKLKGDYVRVQNLYCGICGSDYSHFLGRRKVFPLSLGHEFISIVIDVGKNVTNFEVDDLVVSDFNYRCNNCFYCASKKSHLCVENDKALFSNRAFGKYSDIHASYLFQVKNLRKVFLGTLIEPLSCVIHACNSIGFTTNSNVLILGCGSIGTLVAFYLKAIKKMINVDVIDNNKYKSSNISSLFGCTSIFSYKKKYDIIIEATNTLEGIKTATDIASSGSRIITISHLYGLDLRFFYNVIARKELHVDLPLRNGERKNIIEATNLIKKKWEESYDTLLSIHPLRNINAVFRDRNRNNANKVILSIS